MPRQPLVRSHMHSRLCARWRLANVMHHIPNPTGAHEQVSRLRHSVYPPLRKVLLMAKSLTPDDVSVEKKHARNINDEF